MRGMTRDEQAHEFKEKMTKHLQDNLEKRFTMKGAPEIPSFSTSFGPYTGKNFALYISKNPEKNELKNIELHKFYLEIEEILKSMTEGKIEWRSNLRVNHGTSKIKEIEFIPLSFEGSFLLEVLEENRKPPWDSHMLIYFAVMRVGKLFHEAISSKEYKSTYPREVDIENTQDHESLLRELEETDFYIEIRFIEKSQFTSVEDELVETQSESDLERKIGSELVKEGVPFVVQYKIRADFPEQKSEEVIATPEFIIIDPTGPIAIYCDSRKYHDKKSDQIFKDRRIDRKLQRMGFVVFRFSEKEINNNLQACIEEIKSQYHGNQYAQTLPEVYEQRLQKIDVEVVTEWEKRFIDSILHKISKGMKISTKEEAIIHTVLKKHGV